MEIDEGVDLTTATHIYVTLTYGNNKTLLEKGDSDVTVESANRISIELTQAESLALPVGTAYVQVNYTYTVSGATKRATTDKAEISVYRNSKEVVIS